MAQLDTAVQSTHMDPSTVGVFEEEQAEQKLAVEQLVQPATLQLKHDPELDTT